MQLLHMELKYEFKLLRCSVVIANVSAFTLYLFQGYRSMGLHGGKKCAVAISMLYYGNQFGST